MNTSGGGLPGGYNDDVLLAQPNTKESKEKLTEEIKSRAKGLIAQRNFPEAIKLYTKALETVTSVSDDSSVSILHANRSMCYLSMGVPGKALDDANCAINLDASYVKGYYRKAMSLISLKKLPLAKTALTEGLKIKPDDKDLNIQLKKLEVLLQQEGASSELSSVPAVPKSRNTVKTTASSSSSTVSAPRTTSTALNSGDKSASTTASPPATTKPTTAPKTTDDDVDGGEVFRGYKINSEGRKTTFFNNELDETAKKLIGDIAPKKIDSTAQVASNVANGGSSAWNSAGTYEERICTPWASQYLKEQLRSIAFKTSDDSVSVSIQDVVLMEGGLAQVTMARGKKKSMADFTVDSLKWVMTAKVPGFATATSFKVEGSLRIEDITADKDYDIGELSISSIDGVKKSGESSIAKHSPALKTIYDRHIKKAAGSAQDTLQDCIKDVLMTFCNELAAK